MCSPKLGKVFTIYTFTGGKLIFCEGEQEQSATNIRIPIKKNNNVYNYMYSILSKYMDTLLMMEPAQASFKTSVGEFLFSVLIIHLH